MMDLRFKDELAAMPDLRHRLRRLRWFRATFRTSAHAVTAAHGISFDIDDTRLTRAFLDWIEIVEGQKLHAAINRLDFIFFAAGVALQELIRQNPARARPQTNITTRNSDIPTTSQNIVRFWPEGFFYTNYCVSVVAAIHEQEFGTALPVDPCADDLRTWWSYREIAMEMPACAVAFLDRFLGIEPNWIMPGLVSARPAMQHMNHALQAGALPPLASNQPNP